MLYIIKDKRFRLGKNYRAKVYMIFEFQENIYFLY